MPAFKPVTPTQALIAAIHAMQPAVLRGSVVISTDGPAGLDTVSVVFAFSPELVTAWGEECAKIGVEAKL